MSRGNPKPQVASCVAARVLDEARPLKGRLVQRIPTDPRVRDEQAVLLPAADGVQALRLPDPALPKRGRRVLQWAVHDFHDSLVPKSRAISLVLASC